MRNFGDILTDRANTPVVITSATKTGAFVQPYKDAKILEEAYRQCGSLGLTAVRFGVSKKLILVHMKRFGIARGTHKKSIDVAKVAAELDRGVTLGRIAKSLGISLPTLGARLREAGVRTDRRPRGHTRSASGYIKIRRPGHPRANKAGYVPEHTLLMEAHLGRLLADNEEVHHRNEVRDDNRLENLQLMDRFEHRSMHSSKLRGPQKRKR